MVTEDLDTFLNDFGVTVVSGIVSGLGILDQPDLTLSEMTQSTEYAVMVKTSDFGSLRSGASITVDGTAYTVRENQKIDDGSFSRITLSKT